MSSDLNLDSFVRFVPHFCDIIGQQTVENLPEISAVDLGFWITPNYLDQAIAPDAILGHKGYFKLSPSELTDRKEEETVEHKDTRNSDLRAYRKFRKLRIKDMTVKGQYYIGMPRRLPTQK